MAEIKTPKPFTYLNAISSIDGRFRGRVEKFAKYFSEYATIKGRVYVEIEFLISFLSQIGKPANSAEKKRLRQVVSDFSLKDAEWVWKKDEEINHDTKAVEYFLGEKLKKLNLAKYINFLHIGLTSTDIDNTAFTISLKDSLNEVFIPEVEKLIKELSKLAGKQNNLVMLARTHGKIAVPTTAGKEIKYFEERLIAQLNKLKKLKLGSKISGAVGNHNALVAAYPEIDWQNFSKRFLKSLGLENYLYTTQVEPYDYKVEFIQAVKRINLIVEALDRDFWRYITLGYLSLRDKKGHVGSSTMPQKINPIGFEMSESYCLTANGILDVLEKRLPLNKWQRDLTDKYMLRDFGQAIAMSQLAFESSTEALMRVGFNKGIIDKDLDNHWESIAEGIQTILRTTSYTKPYEKLKEFTRGKVFTKKKYELFVNDLDIDEKTRIKLRKLSPQSYTGYAKK